jgi:hypothetical protein
MRVPRHPTLARKMLAARVKEVVARCPPLAASLCQQGTGMWQVTLKQAGKTKTVYVPLDLKEEVRASILEHRRLRRLLTEITQLQLALIRSHKTEQARRGGRA